MNTNIKSVSKLVEHKCSRSTLIKRKLPIIAGLFNWKPKEMTELFCSTPSVLTRSFSNVCNSYGYGCVKSGSITIVYYYPMRSDHSRELYLSNTTSYPGTKGGVTSMTFRRLFISRICIFLLRRHVRTITILVLFLFNHFRSGSHPLIGPVRVIC